MTILTFYLLALAITTGKYVSMLIGISIGSLMYDFIKAFLVNRQRPIPFQTDSPPSKPKISDDEKITNELKKHFPDQEVDITVIRADGQSPTVLEPMVDFVVGRARENGYKAISDVPTDLKI